MLVKNFPLVNTLQCNFPTNLGDYNLYGNQRTIWLCLLDANVDGIPVFLTAVAYTEISLLQRSSRAPSIYAFFSFHLFSFKFLEVYEVQIENT